MGASQSEKETEREGMGPGAPLATYRYFGTCDTHGRVLLDNPGIKWPPVCNRCGQRIDHNRVTRAKC